jgi:CBS domain-containing protein
MITILVQIKICFMKVVDILKAKGSFIYSVTSNATVYDALKAMAEKNIGALMIIEKEKLIGIFSERDYARKIVLQGKASHDTPVSEIMTNKVLTVSSQDRLEQCMSLMSKNKVRHLPVVDNEKVTGIISISDVVTAIIENQQETIKHLQEYIAQ